MLWVGSYIGWTSTWSRSVSIYGSVYQRGLGWTLYGLGMLLLEKNIELRLLMVWAGFGIGLLLTRYISWISEE
jgi:hypothetical protein